MDRQGTCEIPLAPTRGKPERGMPANQCPRPVEYSSTLDRSALANTNRGGAYGAWNRNYKEPGLRVREVVAPS